MPKYILGIFLLLSLAVILSDATKMRYRSARVSHFGRKLHSGRKKMRHFKSFKSVKSLKSENNDNIIQPITKKPYPKRRKQEGKNYSHRRKYPLKKVVPTKFHRKYQHKTTRHRYRKYQHKTKRHRYRKYQHKTTRHRYHKYQHQTKRHHYRPLRHHYDLGKSSGYRWMLHGYPINKKRKFKARYPRKRKVKSYWKNFAKRLPLKSTFLPSHKKYVHTKSKKSYMDGLKGRPIVVSIHPSFKAYNMKSASVLGYGLDSLLQDIALATKLGSSKKEKSS